MDELTVRHERLARVATAVVVAIVWALCAFVTFTVSEADDTVLSMTGQGGTSGTLEVISLRTLNASFGVGQWPRRETVSERA
jgi:hypothetical protein